MDVHRYAIEVLGKYPELIEPVTYKIPQPSAYEAVKKLVDAYDKEKGEIEWRAGDYKFQYSVDSISVVYEPIEEKETEMADIKVLKEELEKMAKRYRLKLHTRYDYADDKFSMDFSRSTFEGFTVDNLVITEVGTRDIRETLERIERRVVDKFKINLSELDRIVPRIKDVIHNDPATIVFWADNTKTVVKCQEGDIYDPEKGLAMAISKKALGNQGNYCEIFKKWLPEEVEDELVDTVVDIMYDAVGKIMSVRHDPAAGKSKCTGDCNACCPVSLDNKKRAGKGCAKCKHYKKYFEVED